MTTITSTGLGSGLDISGLTTSLVEAEKTPQLNLLTRQAETLNAKISALGSFKSALAGLQGSLLTLNTPSTFNAFSSTSSNESIVTATAFSNAETGQYQVQVGQLAQSQSLASGAYESADSLVGTGTLTIQLGTDPTSADFEVNADHPTLTLSIDSSNNSLTGIRDAINAENAGVSAAVINDGSGYRLTLTSTDSGVKNAMRISVDSADGLDALSYNDTSSNLQQTQTAKDAELTLNGLPITSASNAVTGVLKGVTLNLEQAQPGTTVKLDIQPDREGIASAIEGFVEAYNSVQQTLKEVASYDVETQTASALFGDAGVQNVMSRLRGALNTPIAGLSGAIRTLTDVGITTQADGGFDFDQARLEKALESDPKGVKALFTMVGDTTDAGVAFVLGSTDTQPGSYAIDISQPATQGTLYGEAITDLTIDETNDTLRLRIDGNSSAEIKLTHGTAYTGDTLAAELQSRINGDSMLKDAGVSVEVAYDSVNNRFTFASNTYGSTSKIAITQIGSGASALGLSIAQGTTGLDVAGTIDGEPATGTGQLLTATSGQAMGLQLLITGSQSGERGTVSFSRGLMDSLNSLLQSVLDSENGALTAQNEGLQTALSQNTKAQTDLDSRMEIFEARLLTQFNAMDAMVAKLQSTSDYISQAFASLPYSNLNSNDN